MVGYIHVHTNLLVVKCQHVLGCSWFLHLVTTYYIIKNINERIHHRYLGA